MSALLHLKANTLERWLAKIIADGPESAFPGVPVRQRHNEQVARLKVRIAEIRREARS